MRVLYRPAFFMQLNISREIMKSWRLFLLRWSSPAQILNIARVHGEVSGRPDTNPSLQDTLNKVHWGPLYTYPTSLMQGIVPVGDLFCIHIKRLNSDHMQKRKEFTPTMTVSPFFQS